MRSALGLCLIAWTSLAYCQTQPPNVVDGVMSISILNFRAPRSWYSYFNGTNLDIIYVQAVPLISTSNFFWTQWQTENLKASYKANFGTNVYITFPPNLFTINITNPMHFLTFEVYIEMTPVPTGSKVEIGGARALTLTEPDFTDRHNVQPITAQFDGGESVSLTLSYACSQQYYYGISCDIYCQDQRNTSWDACYTCNPVNGTKMCCDNNIFDPNNNCQRISDTTTTTVTPPLNETTTVSCPEVCFSTTLPTTMTSTIASTMITSHQPSNCSDIPSGKADDDKENLYFWIMIGTAALALISLILVIVLLCCCCIYYRKSKSSPYAQRYPYRPPNDAVYPETKPAAPMPRDPPPPSVTVTSRYDALGGGQRPYSDESRMRRDDPLHYSAPRRRPRPEARPREPSYDPYANSEADADADVDVTNDDSTIVSGYHAPKPPHVYSSGTVTKAAARPISYV